MTWFEDDWHEPDWHEPEWFLSEDPTHRQWDLLIYDCSGTAVIEWQIRSRFPNDSLAVGTMVLELASTESSEFTINAVGGGNGDISTIEDTPFHLIIQDGEEEDAEYNADTNTLTVTVNITGGNDTVLDLREVIDAAGDFYTDASTDDSATIAADDYGDATMTGASNNPAGDLGAAEPRIHDSSNRFFYLIDFPLRVRRLINNRWTCFFQAESWFYPRRWRVSHKGTDRVGDIEGFADFISPIGSGNDPTQRTEYFTGLFGGTYSSVKNSDEVELSPALEEI